MSHAMKAADELKRFAKLMKPVFELSESLEQIGSLQNAFSEASRAKDEAYKARDEAKKQYDLAKADLDKCLISIEEAKIKASEVEAAGYEKGKLAYNEKLAEVAKVDIECQKKKQIVEDQINAAKVELGVIVDQVAAKKSELEAIKKHIEDARAGFLKLVK